jgi:hypothetical protein
VVRATDPYGCNIGSLDRNNNNKNNNHRNHYKKQAPSTSLSLLLLNVTVHDIPEQMHKTRENAV